MSLYKTSDNSGQANLSVLASLVDAHGASSEEVYAFIDKYREDSEQMERILAYINREKISGDTNE